MIKNATFTIVTPDLDQAIRFYKDVLQIPLSYSVPEQVAVFEAGGTTFTIYQDDSGDSHHVREDLDDFKGAVVIGFTVNEPLSEIKRQLETEVKIRGEASPEGSPFKMLFIEDFDGNEVCLSEPKQA